MASLELPYLDDADFPPADPHKGDIVWIDDIGRLAVYSDALGAYQLIGATPDEVPFDAIQWGVDTPNTDYTILCSNVAGIGTYPAWGTIRQGHFSVPDVEAYDLVVYPGGDSQQMSRISHPRTGSNVWLLLSETTSGAFTETPSWVKLGAGFAYDGTTLTYTEGGHTHAATDITSGVLAVARGGTGIGAAPVGSMLYASSADTWGAFAPNTTGSRKFLVGVSSGQSWGTIAASDLPPEVTALASNTTNGLWARTGSGTGAARTITGTTNQVTVSNGDGVSGNPTLSLPQSIATSSDVQFGSIGIGAAPSALIGAYVVRTSTATSVAGYGIHSAFTANPASTSSANFYAIFPSITYNGSSCTGVVASNLASAVVNCDSTLTAVTGQHINASVAAGKTPTITTFTGNTVNAFDGAGATITNAFGNISRLCSIGTGSITANYGQYIANGTRGAGSITANYGLFIESITNATTNYAIYSAGGQSYHAGALGVGQTTPAAQVHVTQGTLGSEVLRLESVATNDDPVYTVSQGRVATTDATVTTLHTVSIAANRTYFIEARVVARRTGGSAGTADDGAAYVLQGTYKTASGTVTLIGSVTTTYSAESVAGWDATLDVSGASVRVRVTGAANTNITWHCTVAVQYVGS